MSKNLPSVKNQTLFSAHLLRVWVKLIVRSNTIKDLRVRSSFGASPVSLNILQKRVENPPSSCFLTRLSSHTPLSSLFNIGPGRFWGIVSNFFDMMSNFFDMPLSQMEPLSWAGAKSDFQNHVEFFRHDRAHSPLLFAFDSILLPLAAQSLIRKIKLFFCFGPFGTLFVIDNRQKPIRHRPIPPFS